MWAMVKHLIAKDLNTWNFLSVCVAFLIQDPKGSKILNTDPKSNNY